MYNNEPIPFSSQMIFENSEMSSMRIGIEICEDLWVPNPPSVDLTLMGQQLSLILLQVMN